MNTHIAQAWKVPNSPVFVALGWFVVGSFLGYVVGHPPSIQRSCNAHPLRAHFLERQIAFETSALRPSSSVSSTSSSSSASSVERLRAAAPGEPVEPASSAASSSSIAAIERPASSSVPSSSSSAESVVSALPSDPESSSSASSVSSASESASASSSSVPAAAPDAFPAFARATYPVGRVPAWGAMKTPDEWNRDYGEMERSEFVAVPAYDLDDLTTPMADLLKDRDDPETIRILTAKLFYSTRFFGSYDLDAGEFVGHHAGIDLKLPKGTPVGAIAGGRVSSVVRHESGLGLHVVIEHRLEDETFYSIYGHLSSASVREGQDVAPGEAIGKVGSTGRSTAPHLHLQVDRGTSGESPHAVYWPEAMPTRAEAARRTVNPVSFISAHAR